MYTDVAFLAAAIPALLIVGISKGGFGGGLGILGVPVLALAVSPTTAAAILLPILCAMDLLGLWAYRKTWDAQNLKVLLPGALTGIVLGTLTFQYLNENIIRLLVGGVAVVFTLHWILNQRHHDTPRPHSQGWGLFWGGISGFTSFVAHAGGPPVGAHLLPQRLDKTLYQGTTVVFFTAVNYTKLVPYGALGLLDTANLMTSAVLLPLAPVGIALGIWLHNRVNDQLFYRLCYGFLAVTGLKLMWDGVSHFL